MPLGGLAGSAASLKGKLNDSRCERCGLFYDVSQHDECPHCAHLDESGLARLRSKIEKQEAGNVALGKRFMLVSIVIGFILLITFLD